VAENRGTPNAARPPSLSHLETSRAVLDFAPAARGARYKALFSDGRNGILMRGRQLVAATLALILEDARYGDFYTAGRPRRTRLKSGSMRAGPTYASHFSVVSQTLGRPSESSAVRFARSKHGPNNACILVGDCHRGTVKPRRSRSWLTHWLLRSVLRGAVRTTARAPWTSRVRRCWCPLRDAHQHLAIAAGELSRDETNPGGEVPTKG
jgi:hypothetical protein